MADGALRDCRILVVEDEYLLAEVLRAELQDEGAIVLGPAGTVERALALALSERRIDGALLDMNLGGEPAYPVADALMARNVPLVFTTGYDPSSIPSRFAQAPRCEKPINIVRIKRTLQQVLAA